MSGLKEDEIFLSEKWGKKMVKGVHGCWRREDGELCVYICFKLEEEEEEKDRARSS